MDTEESRDALLEELRHVEADLAELRRSAEDLRRQIGERWSEPTDDAERAIMITMAEEQEAFAAELEARRDELRRRLGLE
jgi:F0F1-type ATP synthase membrane subunit b/b'